MTNTYAFAGTTMTVLLSGEQTNGAFSILLVTKPSGRSTPPHSHDRELELSYVLSGTLSAETEGRIETRSPGEVLVLPAGRPHRLFNASGETVREFLLCAPAVFDRFVAAAGSPVEPYSEPRPMTTEDRKRLIEIAPDFGVRLLSSAEPDGPATPPRLQRPESSDALGSLIEVLARLAIAEQDLVLTRAVLGPGLSMPMGGHVDQEALFLIEGSLNVQHDGAAWMMLQAGEAVHILSGKARAVRNVRSHARSHPCGFGRPGSTAEDISNRATLPRDGRPCWGSRREPRYFDGSSTRFAGPP